MTATEPGTLYMVATPIGNLSDLTVRALQVLKEVDTIYAEDTRVSKKLLERFGVSTPLRSYREAGTPGQVSALISAIIQDLGQGKRLAYVSDAGTPGISDPGNYLVHKVTESGFSVLPIPGASALTAMLSICGFSAIKPLFVGFLPKKKGHQTLMGQLRATLEQGICDTIIFYESPERILKLLSELIEWNISLEGCLGRELTKLHEELLRGLLPDIKEELASRRTIKGEIVLAIRLAL